MIFWTISVALAVLVTLIMARSLLRPQDVDVPDASEYDLQVYRDQLAELERDVARGVVSEKDAEQARTEISRRILSADANRGTAASGGQSPSRALIAVIAVITIAGSIGMYMWQGAPGYGDLALKDRIAFAEELRENRPDQETAVASLPAFVPPEGLSADFVTLMERLRETVAARPNDLQGHQLLAQNEARIGNFTAAAEAQQKVLRIMGESYSAEDAADYGELLVMAAGGYVSPEAESAFRRALAQDELDGRSRYYIGLMMIQTGRPDIAFRLWDALLRRGPADAAWIDPILAQIDTVSQLAGVNYTVPAIGSGGAPGPSTEDIENAAEMSPEERMEMIGGMVDGLSNRLATEGGPPQDWARLITSLAILGNPDQALSVYTNAMSVFAGNAAAEDIIRAAGSQAGVAE